MWAEESCLTAMSSCMADDTAPVVNITYPPPEVLVLEQLHVRGIIHRDIKPENVCIGQVHSRIDPFVSRSAE